MRLAVSYAAQPGSPLVMKSTQTWWAWSATAWAGVSPIRGRTSSRLMVSNTKGISAAWHAPSRWLAVGRGVVETVEPGAAGPDAARASATRMAGMRKNQSVTTAARMSPALAPGRLAR